MICDFPLIKKKQDVKSLMYKCIGHERILLFDRYIINQEDNVS